MVRSSRGDEGDKYLGLLKLAQALSFLLIFIGGIIIGLATSSHINHYFTTSQSLLGSSQSSHASWEMETTSQNGSSSMGCLMRMEGFVHPVNLSHGMSDEELFWRASMIPFVEEYPFNRLPKVAFLFLTRGPLPLLPLWERFFKGHAELFSVYVHALPGYQLNVSLDSPFYNRQIPSQHVEWGTATLSDAEKRLLANALLDFSNERFVLLSESCIPIYNFQTVYKYLIDSSQSFIELYDEPSRYGRGRYNRKMLPDIELHHWRKGSQWFEMQRKVAIYIVSDTKYYALFKKYCKPACYPDEHYIPTYVNMFHGALNANRSVTWVDWSLGGPHPAMYGAVNITEYFIDSIRNNGTQCSYNDEPSSLCYLFARKFSPSALEPLLTLSSEVMDF